jgi:ketosteroid isomerase-like protein
MSTESEILALNQKLLNAIFSGDWKTYTELCAADITCFEPEAAGNVVEGLPFHKYYFDMPRGENPKPVHINVTMASPKVRMLGADGALLTYVRLVQKLDANGLPMTVRTEETRVWQKLSGGWKHVHFHRSQPS